MTPERKHALAVTLALWCSTSLLSTALATNPLEPRLKTDHFVFYARSSVSDSTVNASANKAEAVFAAVHRFVGRPADTLMIRYTLFDTLEDKGMATGYTFPAHAFGGSNELFVALEEGFEGEAERALAGLIVRKVLGKPKVELLETGLAMYFADNWRTRGYLYWAARIARLKGAADLEALLDNERVRDESPLVVKPLAGAFVSYVIERFGSDALLEQYTTWEPTVAEVASMEREWRSYLAKLPDSRGDQRGDATAEERPLASFQKGFCHAHEGYQIHNGYISRSSDAALTKLASFGVNAVSITPFTYMRDPRSAAPLPLLRQAGAENDESVIHAALTAKRLGMAVMLKPHVWIHGGWPGEIEMAGETEWDLFYDHYWRWIRHYAVLAEMYGIDLLCVGVELARTTVGREVYWRRVFENLRVIYGGKLTYAANWGEEFEKVTFWDSLDFIGVNCYYPLSELRNPSDAELRDGVARALGRIDDVAQRHGKRAIVTEIGFTSSPTPWIEPYRRNWRAAADEHAQARCYEAFISGLERRPHYAGVYWWKWPSFLEYGGPRHSGYTPNGKIAEKVVGEWYSGGAAE